MARIGRIRARAALLPESFKSLKIKQILIQMKQRTITAVFFAAAMLGGIYGGEMPFLLLFTAISGGCLWEFYGLVFDRKDAGFGLRRAIASGLGLLLVPYFSTSSFAAAANDYEHPSTLPEFLDNGLTYNGGFVCEAVLITCSLWFLAELFANPKNPFGNVGRALTGIFYIAMPIALANLIVYAPNAFHPNRIFGLLWLIWTNDTVAYLVGSRIGKTKLFERISPGKTWEGTLGGVVGTVGMAWGLAVLFPTDFSVNQWLAIGAVVAVFGTLGDLVESMLKRSLGVKDSGTLLPGHGGLLDRFDSFLFVLPFVWLVLLLVR